MQLLEVRAALVRSFRGQYCKKCLVWGKPGGIWGPRGGQRLFRLKDSEVTAITSFELTITFAVSGVSIHLTTLPKAVAGEVASYSYLGGLKVQCEIVIRMQSLLRLRKSGCPIRIGHNFTGGPITSNTCWHW